MFLCVEIHLFCVFAAVQGLAFNRFFGFDCGGLVLPVRMCVLKHKPSWFPKGTL